MNVLNKLTIKNIKLNKKRSIGTIIGIILSVALIVAVSNLFTSLKETLFLDAKNSNGYYHLEILNTTPEKVNTLKYNKDVKDFYNLYILGYAKFNYATNNSYPYIKVESLDHDDFDNLKFKLLEGRLPSNNNEIVISNKVKLSSNYRIGDTLSLDIGVRKTTDGYVLNDTNPYNDDTPEDIYDTTTHTYQIVGIVDKTYVDNRYFGLTTNESTSDIDTFIALNNPNDYETSISEILGAKNYKEVENFSSNISYKYNVNEELLRWEILKFSENTTKTLVGIVGVVILIIMITSVFCIRNSFAISTTEKMRMYGMLSSVGATRKQIRRNVLLEGLIFGLIAIPLGIICGLLAVFILVKVVNLILGEFLFSNIEGIVFKPSYLAIVFSSILGFLTIYLSSISASIKASRVSPIDNLRSTNDVKIKAKKLKTPKIIQKVFKTGGVLAYKNLKRSKKKYRTTVISIGVSVFAFISLFTFLENSLKEVTENYQDYGYNMALYFGEKKSEETIATIKTLPNINKLYTIYQTDSELVMNDLKMINGLADSYDCLDDYLNCQGKYMPLKVYILPKEDFAEYAKSLNLDYEKVKDQGILMDTYSVYLKKDNDKHERVYQERRYKYQDHDTIKANFFKSDKALNVEIAKVATVNPRGMEGISSHSGILYLNLEYASFLDYHLYKMAIDSTNIDKLSNDLENLGEDINVFDLEAQQRESQAMLLVFSIFLYGFIAVITLIGVTNIFNTITSNMELRQKEFAMLKSVGMTKSEFNRMINLETLFYSSKSLLYGIIAGLIGSYCVYKAFTRTGYYRYIWPYKAVIISIVFVFVIVYIIMKYSITKINKQNTIETIRRENN